MTPLDRAATPDTARAIAFMVAAGGVIALTSLLAKALGAGESGLHPMQVTAGRFVFAFLALSLFLAARPALWPGLRGAPVGLHVARVLCGWTGITCMFAAVARMPLAEATAISFLSPLVAMALATAMLGERIGPRKLAAAALSLLGAVMILRPGSEAFQPAGLLALAAAGFMGVETIFIKRLTGREPALRILLFSNGLGTILSLAVLGFVWQAPDAPQWAGLVAIGTAMVCGQALFIQSMQRGEASLVAPAFYSVLVFAALYDLAVFGVRPGGWALLGAALILAGAVLLGIRRRGAPRSG